MTGEVQSRITSSADRVVGVADVVRSIAEHQESVETQMDLQRASVRRASSDVATAGSTILEVMAAIEDLSRSASADVGAAAGHPV